ncbi:hypothetical protein ACIOJD_07340 [Streptomyces sp. NPDC088116]|uniref:hypothetical protein n=1 Tax=Streptomyces sp. NPDC088116 TaxID=3365825 RepID=UPI003818E659
MPAKKMVEYSVAVPADSKTSISLNHTPGGVTCTIESKDTRCDMSSRQYDVDEDE